MPTIVKMVTAALTLLFGIYAFLQPGPVANATGVTIDNEGGRAELRIAFGGFFMGLGLAAILLGKDAGYQMLGIAYLVTFASRLVAVAIHGGDILRPEFYVFGAFELISGILLTIPE